MNKEKLRELIKKLVKEYTGTGDSSGNAGDGNNITSPRPFSDDLEELENYMYKSIYGGDGGHYKKYVKIGNYNNLNKQGMFELKKYIKKLIKEQAYGSATLTTQGAPRTRAVAPAGKDPYTGRVEYPYTIGAKTKYGMMEGAFGMSAKDLAATYSLEKLQNIRDEIMGDMEQEAEPEGGRIADMYADQLQGVDDAIAIKQGDSIEGGPSYDEVYLKSKLVDRDMYYEYEDGNITIYPDTTPGIGKTRSSQEIVFTKDGGEIYFLRAFGYKKTYYALEKVFPELPEMRGSSYSGFMNVGEADKLLYSVSIDTAKEMIQAMRKGREAEAGAQSDFYTRQPGTGGTGIDERLNEQEDPAQKAYEIGLKRLQKGVIQFQLKYIEKQKSAAMSQAATAGQQASKGFDEQIDALRDQIKAIDNPPDQEQNESLLESYIKSRKNVSLMTHIDLYKQTTLLEGTMKKLFSRFSNGETNEEVLSHYAKKGISMPETFLSKARKQYENLKKQKLEIDFAEQEAKDIVTIPTKVPNIAMFDLEDDDKKLAKGIYQEKK